MRSVVALLVVLGVTGTVEAQPTQAGARTEPAQPARMRRPALRGGLTVMEWSRMMLANPRLGTRTRQQIQDEWRLEFWRQPIRL